MKWCSKRCPAKGFILLVLIFCTPKPQQRSALYSIVHSFHSWLWLFVFGIHFFPYPMASIFFWFAVIHVCRMLKWFSGHCFANGFMLPVFIFCAPRASVVVHYDKLYSLGCGGMPLSSYHWNIPPAVTLRYFWTWTRKHDFQITFLQKSFFVTKLYRGKIFT